MKHFNTVLTLFVLSVIVQLSSSSLCAQSSAKAPATHERFYIPAPICVLAQTSRTPEEVMQVVNARLNVRFHAPCKKISFPMEDPFLERSKNIWREQAPGAVFAFWLDYQNPQFVLRAFDLSVADEKLDTPLLEWSLTRGVLGGLNYDAMKNLVSARVDQTIESYPYVGFIEPSGFFSWIHQPKVEVVAVKKKTQRHPFLPNILKPARTPQPEAEGVLRQEAEGLISVRFQKGEDFHPKERLWLQELAAATSKKK